MSPTKVPPTTTAGRYAGPPGDETAYWLPRDFNVWEAAWAAHQGAAAPTPVDMSKRRSQRDPDAEVDPEKKARHDEAIRYVKAYVGTWGLVLDIRANPRFGMARFRLSDRQVEVLLEGKARDLVRLEKAEALADLTHDEEYQRHLVETYRPQEDIDATSRPEAARLAPQPTPGAPVGQVTEGMYRMPDGTIAKVQRAIHGSKHLYAKRLVVGDTGSFEFESGLIRRLRAEDRMTLDEAAAFGQLYGWCCVCGRQLTDEKSIAAGIGPVCASKV